MTQINETRQESNFLWLWTKMKLSVILESQDKVNATVKLIPPLFNVEVL